MLKLMLVFLGGGLGSAGRYSIGQLIASVTQKNLDPPHWLNLYPFATLSVNLIGCAAIGIAWAWAIERQQQGSPMMIFLVVGILGGFTTFSAFGWETLDLIQSQRIWAAISYVLVSVVLGLLGVFAGYTIGSSAFGTAS